MGSKIVFVFFCSFAAAVDTMDAVRSVDTRRSRSANRQRRRRRRSRVINMRGQSSSTSNKSKETNNKAAAMRSRHTQARSSRNAQTRRRSGSRRPVSSSCSSGSQGSFSELQDLLLKPSSLSKRIIRTTPPSMAPSSPTIRHQMSVNIGLYCIRGVSVLFPDKRGWQVIEVEALPGVKIFKVIRDTCRQQQFQEAAACQPEVIASCLRQP